MERLTFLLNAEAVWFTTLLTMVTLVAIDQIAIRTTPACKKRDEEGDLTSSAEDNQADVHIIMTFVGLISVVIVGLLTNGIIWPVRVLESQISEPIVLSLLGGIPLISMCILIFGVKYDPDYASVRILLCALPMIAVIFAVTSFFALNDKLYETEQVKGITVPNTQDCYQPTKL